jgi:hypothetical protein
MLKTTLLSLLALIPLVAAGCVSESLEAKHVYFANTGLYSHLQIDHIDAKQDAYGLMHIQMNVTSTISDDQYVDAFVTYTRDGQFVEKLGPQTAVLKGNLPDTLLFNSTQPADDYSISLDYAK